MRCAGCRSGCIFVVDLFECIEQGAHLEDIRACIDLMDGELFRCAILLFYNACHVSRFITEHTIEEKITERAERKLLLDDLVIQQGRTNGTSSKLSTQEMAMIVSYGADKIFASEKGTFTVALARE